MPARAATSCASTRAPSPAGPLSAVVIAFLCCLGLAVVAGPARAHLGQEFFGRFPFVDDAGAVVGGGTSWGLVLPDAAGRFARVCEEAAGPLVTFAHAQPHRGRVLLGTDAGLVQSIDDGCGYDVVDNDLRATLPAALVALPATPDTLHVVTATTGVENRLWRSTDGGDSFVARGPPVAGTLDVVAASDDGRRVCVAGRTAAGPAAAARPLLRCLDDDADAFVDLDAAVAGRVRVSAVVVVPGGDLVVAGLDATAAGFVDRVDPALAVVVDARGPLPRHATHAALVGDTLAVLARNGPRAQLFVTALSSSTPFVPVDGGPTDCLFAAGGRFVGCGKDRGADAPLFLRSDDAVTWAPAVAFAAVRPRPCPTDTPGALRCPPPDERACGDRFDDDYDGAVDCADDDCAAACAGVDVDAVADGGTPIGGCAAAPAAWGLLLPLALRPRRRGPASSGTV